MQYTEKLGLNLFEDTDPILADNFNENTQKIEQNLVQRPYMVTGFYPNVSSDSITLTFNHKPIFIILFSDGRETFYNYFCIRGRDLLVCLDSSETSPVIWDDETNTVIIQKSIHVSTNYNYLALLADD